MIELRSLSALGSIVSPDEIATKAAFLNWSQLAFQLGLLILLFAGVFFFRHYFFRSSAFRRIQKSERILANDKYDVLLKGSGIGVYEWRDLKDRKKPMFWSSRMFELLGFKANSFEPSAEFYFELIHPEDRNKIENSIQNTMSGESADAIECRFRVLTDYRWFRTRRILKGDDQGNLQYIVGSIEDIHEQKMAGERIRQMNVVLEQEIKKRTYQLEVTNNAKTRFLANMGHEIRTPVGLILGFAEILQGNSSLNSEAKEHVHLIVKNGEILSRIINDLLDLSKIEAGKLNFKYSKLNLKDLIQDLEKAFSEQATQKGIRLSFQNLCTDEESVVTDEIRLKQIVYNLLSNAIKFTNQGSIHVALAKKEDFYYIDVVDTGTGISENEKVFIFDEYVQGEVTDAGKTTGTGLGLRLAQNIALALGGNVELVSSQVGKGSHFRMTFRSDPAKLQRQVERKQEFEVSSKLNTFDIFVLDDNEDNIRLAEIFLKRLGCRVRGFTSAKSFFAEMTSLTPDLVLLDIHMPEMNGFQVFDRLREIGYQNPIWALTAYSLNEDIQKILEHGFDDYIRKPISLDGMKRKLTFELKERMHD